MRTGPLADTLRLFKFKVAMAKNHRKQASSKHDGPVHVAYPGSPTLAVSNSDLAIINMKS